MIELGAYALPRNNIRCMMKNYWQHPNWIQLIKDQDDSLPFLAVNRCIKIILCDKYKTLFIKNKVKYPELAKSIEGWFSRLLGLGGLP